MKKHTTLPWTFDESNFEIDSIFNGEHCTVAQVFPDPTMGGEEAALADGRLIVEAVNSHELLEPAVKALCVLNDETVLAGFPGGDRNQTLANVRKMAELLRDAETALESALKFGEEVERQHLTGMEGCFWPVEEMRSVLARIRASKGEGK